MANRGKSTEGPTYNKERTTVCVRQNGDVFENFVAERSNVEVIADVLHQLKDELIFIINGFNLFARFTTDVAAKGNKWTSKRGVTHSSSEHKRRGAAADSVHRGSVR